MAKKQEDMITLADFSNSIKSPEIRGGFNSHVKELQTTLLTQEEWQTKLDEWLTSPA